MARLPPPAQLAWSEDGAPRAPTVGDVYFSKDGGLEETRAVFLAGCGLPEAWAGRDRFAIGELGFGSGLNALATWDLWRRTRPANAVLHFISIEHAPFSAEDARRAHAAFPELAALSERLCARWPVRAYGPQRLWFAEDGFCLTLQIGDAAQLLARMTGPFDAWFLDGFAPALNPDMWGADLFAQIAKLSAPGARAATYTVAGDVRRGLQAAGFTIAKKPGFGKKRERLEARLDAPPAPAHGLFDTPRRDGDRIAIIGGGVAAAALALAAQRRRWPATIFAETTLGDGASGNPAGLVMPRLDRGDTREALIHRAAYLHARALYAEMGLITACGVAERAATEAEARALRDLLDDPPLPEALLRMEGESAVHLGAGVVRPLEVLRAFTAHTTVNAKAPVRALARAGDGWRLLGDAGAVLDECRAVIIANGPHLAAFAQTSFLPLQWSRGQIEWGACEGVARAASDGGYVAPFGDAIVFGATHDRMPSPDPVTPDAASRARNMAQLMRLNPGAAARLDAATLRSRAALRTATSDRLPIMGALPDAAAWRARFAGLAKGQAPDLSAPAPVHEGLYVFGALGSRGFTLAPLLAETLIGALRGEPSALPQPCLDALHPARFIMRALKRGD